MAHDTVAQDDQCKALPHRGISDCLHVLLVCEESERRARLASALCQAVSGVSVSVQVAEAATLDQARALISAGRFDCVVADESLGDSKRSRPGSRPSALDLLHIATPLCPLALVLIGNPDGPLAARALREGAQEVVAGPDPGGAELLRAVRHSVERIEARRELASVNARLEQLAMMDALTETFNRFGLERFLRVETGRSRRSGLPLHAALVDLDDFKLVNDTLGHAAGDLVLAEVARRIVRAVRAHDPVARIGGDEFVILLPDTRIAEAMAVAERVRVAIASVPIPLDAVAAHVAVTASFAVFAVSPEVRGVTELLEQAGDALHRSKRGGKNQVRAARDSDSPAGRMGVVGFRVADYAWFSHPVVALGSGDIVGYEVVGEHRRTGLDHVDELVRRQASRSELVRADFSALQAALRAGNEWIRDGRLLFVHALPHALCHIERPRLIELIHEYTGTPRQLLLTLSDQQLSGDPAQLLEVLSEVRGRCAVGVALDDVGFGRSCLESMIALEPDVVRLHPRLVAGVAASPAKAQVLKRLLRSIRALDIEVLARGVDVEEDRVFLEELGIHLVQGTLWPKLGPTAGPTRAREQAAPRVDAPVAKL